MASVRCPEALDVGAVTTSGPCGSGASAGARATMLGVNPECPVCGEPPVTPHCRLADPHLLKGWASVV